MHAAIRAVIVDVDGVLVDGRPADGQPWSSALQADLGLDPAALHREFFQQHWAHIVHGRAPLAECLAPVLATLAPHITVDRFLDYWFTQDSRVNEPLQRELLALRTRGVAVYLATNQEHRRAAYLMQTLGLAACCDGMVYSAQCGVSKPAPAFFHHMVAVTGLQPRELLLLDDTLANIEAAAALGWHTLHWTRETSPATLRETMLRVAEGSL